MNFLKKHYELVILLVLILFLFVLLFHTLQIVVKKNDISQVKFKIKDSRPDYVNVDQDSDDFEVGHLFEFQSGVWDTADKRLSDRNASYLTAMYEVARCPFCLKLIPKTVMYDGKVCPLCGNLENSGRGFIPPRADFSEKFVPTPDDGDGDGIPDKYEIANRLDAGNPFDAREDADKDGFSNIYEYNYGTDPRKASSHPPFWLQMRLTQIAPEILPVRFLGVDKRGKENREEWIYRFDNPVKGGSSSKYWNNDLAVGDRRYVFTELQPKQQDASGLDVPGGAVSGLDTGYVLTVTAKDGTVLKMPAGINLYSAEDKAYMSSSLGNAPIVAGVGEVFNVGNGRTGIERYRVVKLDPEENVVVLANASKQSSGDIIVGVKSQIPDAMSVREKVIEINPVSSDDD